MIFDLFMVPQPIKNLIELLKTLPSIGPRQATRMAFHIAKLGKAAISRFVLAFGSLTRIKPCHDCFLMHDGAEDLCFICSNQKRRRDVIAIVEKETDLMSLERAKKFNGRYLIIGELKRGGVLGDDQKLKLSHLKQTLNRHGYSMAEEILIATNPTTYGDLSASVISGELKNSAKKITRLGRGIPTGGEIEFADEETLSQALDNRG